MDRFTFLKCHFCSKNYNKLQLINMTDKTVLINEDQVSYFELVLDVCMFKIDLSRNNYVCSDCNDNLLSFHFFKRDAKRYSEFTKHIAKVEILSKVESFLDDYDTLDELHLFQDEKQFSILTYENIDEEPQFVCEIIEEETTEHEEHLAVEESTALTAEDSLANVVELTQQELEWIDHKILCSEIRRGTKTYYQCNVCSKAKALRQPCQHCDDTQIYKTVQEIDLHLRSVHLRPADPQAPLDSISKLLMNTDSDSTQFWNCIHCDLKRETEFICQIESEKQKNVQANVSSAESSKRMGDKLSCESEMATKKRKTNTLNDLSEQQIDWLRQQVAVGEQVKGNKKSFKCTVCECELATQASLTRHLRDIHVLKGDDNGKANFKLEVRRSKLLIQTASGTETIWKCGRCENDRIYKCEQAFKLHLRMTHIRATKIDTAFVAACKTSIMEANGPRDVWQCPDCSRIFKHRDTLRHHIKTEHPNMDESEAKQRMLESRNETSDEALNRIAQKLEEKDAGRSLNYCRECGLKFATARHYYKPKVHKDCHETFKVLAPHILHHKCVSCKMIFNDENSINEHLKVHENPENIQPIQAEGLSQYGASFYKVPTGDADDAVDEIAWKCGHCPVRYFDENDCVTHILLLHTTPLHCFIDNREFGGSSGMSKFAQHMKNKHPELFPDLTYPCGSCKIEFPSIYEKLAHQKVCSNKRLECDYCGKRFLTRHQLQAHILYEKGLTGFSCDFCMKRCKTLSDLKIHENVHSMSRPYECSLCPKTFKTPGARSTHMEGHNDGISCEICGQKLANRTVYKRHKQFQHNQEFRESQLQNNQCHLCGKSFMRKSFFRLHLKQQHDYQLA